MCTKRFAQSSIRFKCGKECVKIVYATKHGPYADRSATNKYNIFACPGFQISTAMYMEWYAPIKVVGPSPG
jgi:hypothetical protein